MPRPRLKKEYPNENKLEKERKSEKAKRDIVRFAHDTRYELDIADFFHDAPSVPLLSL